MPPPTVVPKLTTQVHVDRKSGKQTRVYFANDKVCPKVRLASPLEVRCAGFALIQADLHDAGAWLQEAFKLLPQRTPDGKATSLKVDRYFPSTDDARFKTIKALWFAALVLYGKCFTQAEGRRVKLERANLPKSLHHYHDEVMMLRHTIVAHAGKSRHETAHQYLVLDPNPRHTGFWLRTEISRVDFSDDRKDPVTFEQLIGASIAFTSTKIEELELKIRQRDLLVQPMEHWYAEAKRGRG